jgi:hypothetical protein
MYAHDLLRGAKGRHIEVKGSTAPPPALAANRETKQRSKAKHTKEMHADTSAQPVKLYPFFSFFFPFSCCCSFSFWRFLSKYNTADTDTNTVHLLFSSRPFYRPPETSPYIERDINNQDTKIHTQ